MARTDQLLLAELTALARQSGYRAGPLARRLNISRRQLERYTRGAFGISPQRWLNECRMALAVELLQKQRSVKVVAYELGFKQVSHFSREFKLHHGVSPRSVLVTTDGPLSSLRLLAHHAALDAAKPKTGTPVRPG